MKKLLKVIILILPGLTWLYLIKFSIFGLPVNGWEILIYLAALAYLANRVLFKQPEKASKLFFLSAIVTIFITLIAIWVSPEKLAGFGILKGWIIPALLTFWMLRNVLSERSDFYVTMSAMIGQGVLVGLVAIVQVIPSVQDWWLQRWPDLTQYFSTRRYTSIFNSPNSAAMILAPSFVVSVYTLIKAERKQQYYLDLFALGIIAIGLFFTHSRGGWISAAVGLLLLISSQVFHFSRKTLLIISGLVIAIFNPITISLPVFVDPNNADIRVQIWQKSWQMIKNHPIFGIGLGHFQQAFQDFTLHQPNFDEYITPYAIHPHNIILYIWLSFGLIGLLGFVWLIWYFVSKFLKSKSALTLLGFALISTTLIHGMVDLTIFKNDLIIWFIFALLLVVNTDNESV